MKKRKEQAEQQRLAEMDPRWLDVKSKNVCADEQFVYAVKTTGIYCRPSCSAKLAKRENVIFFRNWQEAEAAHYHACKRCHPEGESNALKHERMVVNACRLIEERQGDVQLPELAQQAGMSLTFFHRLFKKMTGITPKQYGNAVRLKNLRAGLDDSDDTITSEIYKAGFGSSSRFYAQSNAALGMPPSVRRRRGKQEAIQFAIAECTLGSALVARSEKGVCAIMLGDDPAILLDELQERFSQAELKGGDEDFEQLVARVVALIENPADTQNLPLDIRGTAFQQRVWQALLTIPAGQTVSYTQLAEMIGLPQSVRAVANACGQNKLAVAVPCHRIVRLNGDLSGYRWGIDRKRALLLRERKAMR